MPNLLPSPLISSEHYRVDNSTNPPMQFPIINLENYYSFMLDPLFSEPTPLDFEYQNVFGGVTAHLDKDIASMYYALVKILICEILMSAYS
jgi:hypothetical protein